MAPRTPGSISSAKYTARKIAESGTIICACGCGAIIPALDTKLRPRMYAIGHNNRGKSNTWSMTESPSPRALHKRAAKIKRDVVACEWDHLGGCTSRLEVAHVDGNEQNNEPSNLKKLCKRHHALLDFGRIDPENLTMPRYRTTPSGQTIYEHSERF